jgi:pimeloyl-ACP methyl ester carboxylesterase
MRVTKKCDSWRAGQIPIAGYTSQWRTERLVIRVPTAIESGIAGSKRVIISDTGHLMYLEKPEEFSRAAIIFVESNSD